MPHFGQGDGQNECRHEVQKQAALPLKGLTETGHWITPTVYSWISPLKGPIVLRGNFCAITGKTLFPNWRKETIAVR